MEPRLALWPSPQEESSSLLLGPDPDAILSTKCQALDKAEASGPAVTSAENAEILEKVEKVIAALEGGATEEE